MSKEGDGGAIDSDFLTRYHASRVRGFRKRQPQKIIDFLNGGNARAIGDATC
jgi:hypothetical protein